MIRGGRRTSLQEARKQPDVRDEVSRTRKREKGHMQEKLKATRGQKRGFWRANGKASLVGQLTVSSVHTPSSGSSTTLRRGQALLVYTAP